MGSQKKLRNIIGRHQEALEITDKIKFTSSAIIAKPLELLETHGNFTERTQETTANHILQRTPYISLCNGTTAAASTRQLRRRRWFRNIRSHSGRNAELHDCTATELNLS